MPALTHFTSVTLLTLMTLTSGFAQADGLTDLKNALDRLQGTGHLSAELEAVSESNRGEGEDKKTTKGRVKVWLEDDIQGLQVLYSNEVLSLMETEARQKAEDEEATTETLNAVDDINAIDLHAMLSASSSLLRNIGQAGFLDETTVSDNGEDLRLLRFSLPMEFFIDDKGIRGYVKKFAATYKIWIDSQGIPQKSLMEFNGKGRAYIFFKISASGSRMSQYQVVNDRLVIVRSERQSENDSTFGVFSRSATNTLKIHNKETNNRLASN
ncbi:hypothetical protein SG34_011265 [Thalassomonas viridans]|uniref:Uncharacterized protein n=1 Tax=Thalassomonas viridans TaxID=137584 RepID=A0AAF0CCI2_9GAMM|nr:hypothetical protein [Thalassomonas viridans]WDE07409.1 hypothetical protein SG34_011265 [Thalassomonas viridans]